MFNTTETQNLTTNMEMFLPQTYLMVTQDKVKGGLSLETSKVWPV